MTALSAKVKFIQSQDEGTGEKESVETRSPLEVLIDEIADCSTPEDFRKATVGCSGEFIEDAILFQGGVHKFRVKGWYTAEFVGV